MKLALQVLVLITITSVLYQLLTHPKGVTALGASATGFVTGLSKATSGR